MPKKLEAHEAKPFQPLKTAFVRSALDDSPPGQLDQGGVAVAIEPDMATEQDPVAPPTPRRSERKVVQMAPEPEAPPRRPRAIPEPMGGERLNRPLKVKLTSSERTEITRITNELSMALGTPLSVSHITRALLTVFRHAESEVQQRARQGAGSLKRPPNDDLTAIAVFEHELSRLLMSALREAKPLR